MAIAENSINDSLFRRILIAQSTAGVYEWDHDRLEEVPEQHHKDPVTFFLSEFRSRGLPTVKQFVAKDGYTDDDVTGSTVACSEKINFNVDNLDRTSRTPTYVAGTIVHERVHSFCYQHRTNDSSEDFNLCDFAYHAGHLAIVIAQYRDNNSQPITKPSIEICASLVKRLKDEKIIIR
ncbi:hypothetical protein LRS06_21385 [Hymenobacter sp. J193]|uniref:hypothetical protein n=1 Tax=Hymenobacter sp. J193 TaxID=2898429 RepID=UPI002150F40F|nr:hypothetical protein [Hymenobacter sp. J193]MCR5890282.1 hypothetical protein [Hymenobacter sp. J193]